MDRRVAILGIADRRAENLGERHRPIIAQQPHPGAKRRGNCGSQQPGAGDHQGSRGGLDVDQDGVELALEDAELGVHRDPVDDGNVQGHVQVVATLLVRVRDRQRVDEDRAEVDVVDRPPDVSDREQAVGDLQPGVLGVAERQGRFEDVEIRDERAADEEGIVPRIPINAGPLRLELQAEDIEAPVGDAGDRPTDRDARFGSTVREGIC